jgi:hypothetical protein
MNITVLIIALSLDHRVSHREVFTRLLIGERLLELLLLHGAEDHVVSFIDWW